MAGANTLEFTDQNFEQQVLNSEEPVIVDFWAEWCAPCRMLGPVIDELAKDYSGKVKVGKLDIDANTDVTVKYTVSSIPTVMIFHKGQVVQKFVGVRGKKDFQQAIDKIVSAG
ncbi:MAG: thioredoxin [Planctomycetota bacterium]